MPHHSLRRRVLASGTGRLLASGAAVTSVLALAACGGGDDDPATAAGRTSSSTADFKAVVLSDGPKNDKSWSNSVFNGTQEAATALGAKVDFVGSLTSAAEYTQQGSAYASQGYNMILITNGAQLAAATQIAQQFPDVTVCQGPEAPTDEQLAGLPDNMCIWNVKQQDGTFLAGVLAGLVTQTNKLGSVAGGDFPAVTRQPEGFILGARCVNPDASIDVTYTGSFSDVAAAQAAATTQVAGGADVFLSAVDGAVSGIYSAAEAASRDTFVIPSYFDAHDQAPDVVLTSVLYNLNGITADLLKKGAADEIKPKSYEPYNYANLQVGELADFHGNAAVTPQIQAKLTEIEGKLRSGAITVPDEDGADAPLSVKGAGSSIDPASIGC